MSISRRYFIKGIAALVATSVFPDVSNLAFSTVMPEKIVPSPGEYFRKGDVVTFQGVYALNPVTKKSTGVLQQFVITDDNSLSVYPPLVRRRV